MHKSENESKLVGKVVSSNRTGISIVIKSNRITLLFVTSVNGSVKFVAKNCVGFGNRYVFLGQSRV